MALNNVPSGKSLPNDVNVVIEITAHSEPVKYEVDKESGAIFVDRLDEQVPLSRRKGLLLGAKPQTPVQGQLQDELLNLELPPLELRVLRRQLTTQRGQFLLGAVVGRSVG